MTPGEAWGKTTLWGSITTRDHQVSVVSGGATHLESSEHLSQILVGGAPDAVALGANRAITAFSGMHEYFISVTRLSTHHANALRPV